MQYEYIAATVVYLLFAIVYMLRKDKEIEEAVSECWPSTANQLILCIRESIIKELDLLETPYDQISEEEIYLIKFDYLYAYPEYEKEIEKIFYQLTKPET